MSSHDWLDSQNMTWKLDLGRDLPNWTWMCGRWEADDSGLDFHNLCTFGVLDVRGVVPCIPWRLDMAIQNWSLSWFGMPTPVRDSQLSAGEDSHQPAPQFISELRRSSRSWTLNIDKGRMGFCWFKAAACTSKACIVWKHTGGNLGYSCREGWHMTVSFWNGCGCISPNSFWILWIHLYQILSCPSW